jgi:NAD(P)H-dependent flavin oxidoreductase YrpB (nitropropane dioxygenase family)
MKFNSRYPIVAMPMNGVSNIDLAIAVSQAGGVPSLSVFNHYTNGRIDLLLIEKQLQQFTEVTGSSEIIISMLWEHFMAAPIVELLLKYKVTLVELFVRPADQSVWQALSKHIDKMSSNGICVMFKTTARLPDSNFDAIVLKGPLAAGRSFGSTRSLESQYDQTKEKVISNIIPSGGIGNPEQVKYFMDRGALAVGVGTLLAASEESCVSKDTKQKIIESTSKDIQLIGPLNCRGLLFSRLDNDDDNNTKSLYEGIKGTTSGCIYVGNGIDYINKIMPVKDIIEWLVKDVDQ